MSDLREQLIARIDVHLCQFPTSSNAHSVYSNIQPIIEAELQKEQREIARWIRDCQKLLEELAKANKLLEQTIEVLEEVVDEDSGLLVAPKIRHLLGTLHDRRGGAGK